MPARSSEPVPTTVLFGRQRQLHAALGGGKIADILLWSDKKSSSAVLAAITIIWFLFEVVEFPFVTLFCDIVMLTMLVLLVWYNAAGLISWYPPDVSYFQISEHTFIFVYSKFNSFLREFFEISTGKHLGLFFVTFVGLWIMSGIGSYFTVLNLLYITFLGILTLPTLYERYEYEVDYIASKGNEDVRRLFKKLDTNILSKIPRGPVKGKKSR